MRRSTVVLLVILVAGPGSAFGQESFPIDKATSIAFVKQEPVVDGVLDDPIWREAVLVDDFHQVRPVEYSKPTQRTEFLLAHDESNLYVGARVFEDDPELVVAKVLRQGESLGPDDRIGVILDPFKTLSFNEDQDWGINFIREIVRNGEQVSWSSRDRNYFPSVAGTVSGISGVSQGRGLDIVPSLSFQAVSDRIGNEDDENTEPSLDLYYKVTPSLNASLTFNTDFSATEVDNRQVDLSRFSQFFPEKRSFFLRESEIFEFGGIGVNYGNGSAVAFRQGKCAAVFLTTHRAQ